MIDLTKICVRSYLETFKEGVIAREALIPVIKRAISSGYLTDAEINEFKDGKFSRDVLGLNYPMLSENREYISGNYRYYAEEITWYKTSLYLTNDWYDRHKSKLIDLVICIANELDKKFLRCMLSIAPTDSPAILVPSEKNTSGKTTPYNPLNSGCDERTEHVYYNDNVNENEQVPGLCKTIECMYERILGFARNVFEEVHELREIRRIPIILKKECPTKTYYNSDEYIAQKLNEISKERDQITAQDVARVSRKTDRITGEFCQNDGDPYIVIYYRQFNANTWEEYIAMIANTLAHEYAHYLEYSYCNGVGANPFIDSRVSEAIADFFGVLFSINGGNNEDLQVAKNRYKSWVEWFGSSWPYTNALYFVKNMPYPLHTDLNDYYRYGNIKKLISVFCLTSDTDAAYNELTH